MNETKNNGNYSRFKTTEIKKGQTSHGDTPKIENKPNFKSSKTHQFLIMIEECCDARLDFLSG